MLHSVRPEHDLRALLTTYFTQISQKFISDAIIALGHNKMISNQHNDNLCVRMVLLYQVNVVS